MINNGLMIINHNVPCSCACRYCFFRSCKTSYGVPYDVGEKIALKFQKWREDKQLSDFSLCYAISHCADYPELLRNIELNKRLNFVGHYCIQINGIGLRDTNALNDYLEKVKQAGVTTIDTTFYGLEEYHDRFAARKGDFNFLINIVQRAISLGLMIQPTFVALEENKKQLPELMELLTSFGCERIHGFLHDYRGNGEKMEDVRLKKNSYDALPEVAKSRISVRNHKTEAEWIQNNFFTAPTSRNLVLALRPDNIDMINSMTCGEMIDYLVDLDEKYYNAIPDITVLSKLYGDISNTRLYRQRDLQWKWSKAYIADHQLSLHDVTDERNCGSMRY